MGRTKTVLGAVGCVALAIALMVTVVRERTDSGGPGASGQRSGGETPTFLWDFARLCRQDGTGDPYGDAAPYGDDRPHPAVLFEGSSNEPVVVTAGPGRRTPETGDIQLVACSHRTGRASNEPVERCPYTYGPVPAPADMEPDFHVTYYQGHYVIDVYEARTGRMLGSRTVSGSDSVSCGDFTDESGDRDDFTTPDWAAYEAAIEEFVIGS